MTELVINEVVVAEERTWGPSATGEHPRPDSDLRPLGTHLRLDSGLVDALLLSGEDAYHAQLAYLLSVVSAWSYSDGPTLKKRLKYYGLPAARVARFGVVNEAMYVVSSAYLIRSASIDVGALRWSPSRVLRRIQSAHTAF